MKKHNEKDSRLENLRFSRSEYATATVIGAVLLLGIIFSVLTIIWVGCVPEWKRCSCLLRLNGQSFYKTLRDKLMWGLDRRN